MVVLGVLGERAEWWCVASVATVVVLAPPSTPSRSTLTATAALLRAAARSLARASRTPTASSYSSAPRAYAPRSHAPLLLGVVRAYFQEERSKIMITTRRSLVWGVAARRAFQRSHKLHASTAQPLLLERGVPVAASTWQQAECVSNAPRA